MSNLLSAEFCSGATRRPVWSKPDAAPHFAAWTADAIAVASVADNGMPVAEDIIDIDALKAEAFAQGFDEGQRVLLEAVQHERTALSELAGSLEVLQPEPTGALAAMLAETVDRLVRQIVGEVQLDQDTLLARCEAAAALIGDEVKPASLRINPADAERLGDAVLPVPMIADESVAPGMLLLETAQGWIEDGAAVRLERLRSALDGMGPNKATAR
jgi:flagellar assembly protein FliH